MEQRKGTNVGLESVPDASNSDGSSVKSFVNYANIVISPTINFPEYSECLKGRTQVVTSQWVWDSITHKLLQPFRPYSPDPRHILSKDYITACGLCSSDVEAIHAAVYSLGGQFTEIPHALTTHLIAEDINNEICQKIREIKPSIKIVLPHWIDDCLKYERRIDETPYLLSNPTILDNSGPGAKADSEKSKHKKQGSGKDLQGAIPHELFKNRRFFLDADLQLSSRQKVSVQRVIFQAGGLILEDLKTNASETPALNVYIGEWRSGSRYVESSRKGWVVANLRWLYAVVTSKEWKSPYHDLLHYPKVPNGMPDLQGQKISLTNFSGEQRTYVKELIEALGATCESTFRENAKLLIAGQSEGRKFHAAKHWGINVVNLLWLEETYAEWKVQAFTHQRYITFPRIGDISTVFGHVELDPQALKQFYLTAEELQLDKEGRKKPRIEETRAPKTSKARPESSANRNSRKNGTSEKNKPEPPKDDDRMDVDEAKEVPVKESSSSMAVKAAKDMEIDKPEEISDNEEPIIEKSASKQVEEPVVSLESKPDEPPGKPAPSRDPSISEIGDNVSSVREKTPSYSSRASAEANTAKTTTPVLSSKKPIVLPPPTATASSLSPTAEGAAVATPPPKKGRAGTSSLGSTGTRASSGRRAKDAALSKLHMDMDDLNEFEKMKRRDIHSIRLPGEEAGRGGKARKSHEEGDDADDSDARDGSPTRRRKITTAAASSSAGSASPPAKKRKQKQDSADTEHTGSDQKENSPPSVASPDKGEAKSRNLKKQRQQPEAPPEEEPSSEEFESVRRLKNAVRASGDAVTGRAQPTYGKSKSVRKRKSAAVAEMSMETIDLVDDSEASLEEGIKREGSNPVVVVDGAARKKKQKTAAAAASSDHAPSPQPRTKTLSVPGVVTVLHTPMKVMLTYADLVLTADEMARLARVGIHVTAEPLQATHVVTRRVSRTEKFLVALSRAPVFLVPQFLKDVLAALTSSFSVTIDPDDKKYELTDDAIMESYGADLRGCLARARELRGTLLKGVVLNMAPDVNGGFDVMDKIATAHGARPSVLIKTVAKMRACRPSVGDRIFLIAKPEQHEFVDAFLKMYGDEDEDGSVPSSSATNTRAKKRPRVRPFVRTQEWLLRKIITMQFDCSSEPAVLLSSSSETSN